MTPNTGQSDDTLDKRLARMRQETAAHNARALAPIVAEKAVVMLIEFDRLTAENARLRALLGETQKVLEPFNKFNATIEAKCGAAVSDEYCAVSELLVRISAELKEPDHG